VRGQVRAVLGDPTAARADLDAAVSALDELGSRLELARALHACAALHGPGWEADAARAAALLTECGTPGD
jgi:hypothetical protein